LIKSFAFNNAETALRIPVLMVLVTGLGVYSVIAQGLTLGAAFVARFLFVSRVVYKPRSSLHEVPTVVFPAEALEGERAA
jgi:dolichol-phosphate mannosyltransferase